MALQGHENASPEGSRGGRMKAAHYVVGRYLAERLAGDFSKTTFRLKADRSLTYDDNGVARPVTLFHFVSFAEQLQKTGQAADAKLDGDTVEIRLSAKGRDDLVRFHARTADRQPAVPRKQAAMTARELMRRRIENNALALGAALKAEDSDRERIMSLMLPVLLTLSHGPRSAEDLTKSVGIRMRVPSSQLSAEWLQNGVSFEACVNHVVRHLSGKGLIARGSARVGLTDSGRTWLAEDAADASLEDGLEMPMQTRQVRGMPAPEKPNRVMSEAALATFLDSLAHRSVVELLRIWGNAVKIRSDEGREAEHLQSDVIVRGIDELWRQKAPRGEIADGFRWPTTDIRLGRRDDGRSREGFDVAVEEGMLRYLGYKVGMKGESRAFRQRMLVEIFQRSLPPVFPDSYMRQWGDNGSPRRLQKMADCIASFARNAARRSGEYDDAIRDWDEDLAFLKERFYEGRFEFGWPGERPAARDAFRP